MEDRDDIIVLEDMKQIQEQEVIEPIKQLKLRKAPGINNITSATQELGIILPMYKKGY